MTTTLERIVHPVGVGAFITERFYGENNEPLFTAVYDCGKKSIFGEYKNGVKILNQLCDDYFENRQPIDLLFLSHFDDDHVNGVKHLIKMKYADPQKTKIVLPLIDEDIMDFYEILGGKHYSSFISMLEIKGFQLIFVEPLSDESNQQEEETINIDEIRSTQKIKSLTRLSSSISHHIFWEYIPFHLQDRSVFDSFRDHISKKYPNHPILRNASFANLTIIEHEQLKEAYKSFHKNTIKDPHVTDINMNAMLLISKATDESVDCEGSLYTLYHNQEYRHSCISESSALYTSDVALGRTLDIINSIMHRYLMHPCGLLQIPHHGSKYCYHEDFFSLAAFNYFCNADQDIHNPHFYTQYFADFCRWSNRILGRNLFIVDTKNILIQSFEFDGEE